MKTKFQTLSGDEFDIIRRSIEAVVRGSEIDDDEFETRVGIDRGAGEALLRRWAAGDIPSPDSTDLDVVRNCVNEVCYGIRYTPTQWKRYFGVSREDVRRLFERLKSSSE